MIPNRPGYYWIKIKDGNYYSGWIIGEYGEYWKFEDCWEQVGSVPDWGDPVVIEIGPRIIPPGEVQKGRNVLKVKLWYIVMETCTLPYLTIITGGCSTAKMFMTKRAAQRYAKKNCSWHYQIHEWKI